ncbi:MAG: serine hydrolase domain-containing protein [Roseibacillus sp.]
MKTLPAGALLVLFTFPALAEKSLLIGELPSAKPEQVGMSSAKLAKVDAKVEELIATKRLAGASVMITRKGRVVYNKTFGLRDIENEKPMEADTIFRIYSMSKAISSAAAMILSDEGKIDIDDPIANYLPEFKKVKVWKEGGAVAPANAPTVRDLLRHTTGYSYGGTGIPEVDQKQKAADPFARENTLAEFSKRMATVPLAFEPGKGWMYGVSTDLLGAVVQSASGMPFEKFLQQRIFAPLGMVDTGFLIPEGKKARVAVVYNSDKRGKLTNNNHDNFRYTTKSKLPSGGGGLVSTIRDYTRFLQMIANGGELHGTRLLKKETVAAMTRNQLKGTAMPVRFPGNVRHGTGFGLGFSVRIENTDWNADGRIGEYGWGGLLSTHYWISPKDDLVVVTMEQTLPYDFLLEDALKPLIYAAVEE